MPTRLRLPALLALIVGQICLHSCMAGVAHGGAAAGAARGPRRVGGRRAARPVRGGADRARAARRAARRPPRLPPADARGGRPDRGRRRSAPSSSTYSARPASRCSASPRRSTGAGANVGLIAIQRTAGRDGARRDRAQARLQLARPRAGALERGRAGARRRADRPERLSPRLRRARAAAAGGPGLGAPGAASRRRPPHAAPRPSARRAWDLLHAPGLRRLLLVNWLLSSSWDVHTFVVPDPRPRARLQRLGDRPGARRLRDRGDRGAAGHPVPRAPAARGAGAGRRDARAPARCSRSIRCVRTGLGDGRVRGRCSAWRSARCSR